PETVSLKEVGSPAWDPICMASDQAFAYLMPGLMRLAFEQPYYSDQLLFHINNPGRAEYLNKEQAAAMRDAIWVMVETQVAFPQGHLPLHLADEAIRRMERILRGEPPSEHA